MIVLSRSSSSWNTIGVERVTFYDSCIQTTTEPSDGCPVVFCGCVVKVC